MMPGRALTPALAMLAVLGLMGCTNGTGVATPTPTVLTENEAYAQAEDAFRAYIDALNQIDVADPATFEPAFALTTGTQNAFDRRQYSTWHADGWVKSGSLAVTLAEPRSLDQDSDAVEIDVCLDVSDAGLVDSDGASQISPDRSAVVAYTVQVERDAARGYLVADYFDRSDGPAC